MLKKTNNADVNGTCLQGYVYATYAELVEAFGEPSHDGDGYKVDAEWELEQDGKVVTIYNYKDGLNYLGEPEGTPVENINRWHIGGKSAVVVELVRNAMPNAIVKKN